ncbi:MAG: CoA-binding protein [Chloroflexi bacterium]|nr:CoA-binding protein [Chloroflexota bacterium]
MTMDYKDPAVIETLLTTAKTIAVVGLSPRADRDSNEVAAYLQAQGYQIIPVNPQFPEILGQTCYPDLASIPVHVDVVDVFRRASQVMPLAEQAAAIGAGAIWFQDGVINEAAAQYAANAGLAVVMDTCMLREHRKRSRPA